MRYITMVILTAFLISTGVFADVQQPKAQPTADTAAEDKPQPASQTKALFTLKPKSRTDQTDKKKEDEDDNYQFSLGETLQIEVTGDLVERVTAEWQKTKKITLHLDGVPMMDLASPPVMPEAGDTLILNFDLVRESHQTESRQAWDTLFRRTHGYEIQLTPAISLGGELPRIVQSANPLMFHVAPEQKIRLTIGAGIIIFLVLYIWMAKGTNMLKDNGTQHYSLGKSQMAFWGMLVILTFAGVWYLTGTMERIPAQVMILLGISAATGLGSVVIGDSKRTTNRIEVEKRREEQKRLTDKKAASPSAITTAEQARLDSLPGEIDDLVQRGKSKSGGNANFFKDICNDGDGMSFHRLQAALWTFILGIIFVKTVSVTMSMPEFSDTLLTLMGISNGTYLGFKFPEKV